MTRDEKKRTSGEITPAEPIRLADLVGYSEGSVVSRTIAQSQAGTLTVFAFDAGQELSEHTAPFDAYVQVLDGEVELTISGEPTIAQAGETVRMPADIPHAVRADSRFKMLLIMIRG